VKIHLTRTHSIQELLPLIPPHRPHSLSLPVLVPCFPIWSHPILPNLRQLIHCSLPALCLSIGMQCKVKVKVSSKMSRREFRDLPPAEFQNAGSVMGNSSFSSLNRHIRDKHPFLRGTPLPRLPNGTGDCVCPTCGKAYRDSTALIRHNSNSHKPGGPRHQCEKCGKSYNRSESLKTHKKKCN